MHSFHFATVFSPVQQPHNGPPLVLSCDVQTQSRDAWCNTYETTSGKVPCTRLDALRAKDTLPGAPFSFELQVGQVLTAAAALTVARCPYPVIYADCESVV